MRVPKPLVVWLALAAGPVAAAETVEITAQGQLSQAEFRQWLEGAQPEPPAPPPGPPVAVAVLSARYELDLSGAMPLVEATFEVENFTDEWQLLPLLPAGAAVQPLGAVALVGRPEGIALQMRDAGRSEVRLRFTATSEGGREQAVRFPILPATSQLLSVSGVAPDRQLTVAGGARTRPAGDGADAQAHVFQLASDLAEVVVSVADLREEPERESRWLVNAETMVHHADGWLEHETRLRAQALDGDALGLELVLAGAGGGLQVSGDDLAEWRLVEPDKLTLRWRTRGRLEREVILRHRIASPPLAPHWRPVTPAPATPHDNGEAAAADGAEEVDAGDGPAHLGAGFDSLIVLAVPTGADLAADGLQTGVEPAHLPAWMRERLAGETAVTLRHRTDPEIEVSWPPRVDTDTMVVAGGRLDTRLVVNGSMLTHAEYRIEHESSARWRVALPEDAQLLEASVGGRRVQPVLREPWLEFDLPHAGAEPSTTRVEFSYTARTTALDPVSGGISLQSPRTPLFAHRVDWRIVLPDNYRIEGIESNAEPAPVEALRERKTSDDDEPRAGGRDHGKAAPAATAGLRHNLSRDEPTQVELFYRSHNLQE